MIIIFKFLLLLHWVADDDFPVGKIFLLPRQPSNINIILISRTFQYGSHFHTLYSNIKATSHACTIYSYYYVEKRFYFLSFFSNEKVFKQE